jgi:hypothetical protein
MGIFSWLKKILTYDPSVYKPPNQGNSESGSGMTEADLHSGPDGYSPNTAYPDTFYGSGRSSDSDQDEGDLNR